MGVWIATGARLQSEVANHPLWRRRCLKTHLGPRRPLSAPIFVSLELSRRSWLITSLSPGAGEKMSRHAVAASDVSGLLQRFTELRRKATARTGQDFAIIVIQEAGLDGFWIHRVLEGEGLESHVVDAASILTSRRRRRAKTDRIDGETLARGGLSLGKQAFLARGQPLHLRIGRRRRALPDAPTRTVGLAAPSHSGPKR